MLVTCQACGAENDDEARYCDQCATPLAGALLENSAGTPSTVLCKACGATNDSAARFCDQCGAGFASAGVMRSAPVDPGPAAAPVVVTPRPQPAMARGGVSWLGLGVILLVIGGLVFLLYSPGSKAPAAAAGGDPAAATFQQVQQQLKKDKDALAKDPLNTDAIKDLYTMYSQIGPTDKVRPYLEGALAEAQKRLTAGTMQPGDATKLTLDLGTAAMNGNDSLGAIDALKSYYQLNPKRVDTAKMIGDIYYDLRMPDEAVDWYSQYLKIADPAKDSGAIINAQVDQATMRMEIADKENKPEELTQAVSDLKAVVAAHPENWPARFNYGQALLQSTNKSGAEEAWTACLKLAGNATEKWRTQAALADLHGQPEPPKPAGMEDVGSGSASESEPAGPPPDGANPHGAMGEPPPGTPNPHVSPTFGQGVEGK